MSTVELMPASADIFDSGADALVNPVDASGAQGKGLALEFKRRYPGVCAAYRAHCRSGGAGPGQIWSCRADRWLFFLATKRHWRESSSIPYIATGMYNLRIAVVERLATIESVALPALGCGLGGLPWGSVLPIIQSEAEVMARQGIRVFIYPPR